MKSTAEKIAIMQAFLDGKTIEAKDPFGSGDKGKWIILEGEPNWQWGQLHYRIKPEPKEIWVNEHSHGKLYAYNTEHAAQVCTTGYAMRTAVLYREVIE
jgi:hypothetical protein